jgi:hypothetical protein
MIEYVGLKLRQLLEARKMPELTPEDTLLITRLQAFSKERAQGPLMAERLYHWAVDNAFYGPHFQDRIWKVPKDWQYLTQVDLRQEERPFPDRRVLLFRTPTGHAIALAPYELQVSTNHWTTWERLHRPVQEAREQPELTPAEQEMLSRIDAAMKRMAQVGPGPQGRSSIAEWLRVNSFVELLQHYERAPRDHGLRIGAFSIKFPQNRRQRKYPNISSATAIVYRDTARQRHMVQVIYKHPYNPHRPRDVENEFEEPDRTDDIVGPYYWVRALAYNYELPTPPPAQHESEDKDKKAWEQAKDHVRHYSGSGWAGLSKSDTPCNHKHRTWQSAWACAQAMLKEHTMEYTRIKLKELLEAEGKRTCKVCGNMGMMSQLVHLEVLSKKFGRPIYVHKTCMGKPLIPHFGKNVIAEE